MARLTEDAVSVFGGVSSVFQKSSRLHQAHMDN